MKSATTDLFLDTGATFSPCGTYRYRLWRTWDERQPTLNWIMLNPSTADAVANDPTIERCQRRAKLWDFGGIVVTNIFAFRSTFPDTMKAAADPVGPDNDGYLLQAAQTCSQVICAWGNHGAHRGRSKEVRELLKFWRLWVLKVGMTGEPVHPLYQAYDVKPVEWK
jgi:hypothetical protein